MDKNLPYFDRGRKPEKPAENRRSKRKRKIFAALVFLAIGVFFIWNREPGKNSEEIIINTGAEEKTPNSPEKKTNSYRVAEGDIPAEVFAREGKLTANEIESFLSASKDIYDFTNIKIGQELKFTFGDDEQLEKIRYYPDTENVIIAETAGAKFAVKKEKIPYATTEEKLFVKIDEFLYKDALDAGLSEASVLEIADVFSFDIDFTTEIQPDDEMKVVYEKRTLDGKPAPDGKVLAARFTNSGQDYFAYYFESNGEPGHYDAEGHELMRQFLRAPLSYRRISSGFTGARYHPITKTVTAHYQIDYAAPSGTPVVSTARGTVTGAGYEGGWGNMVRIRHDNGFTTHYGHLSGYGKGIKSGASVSQGQVVGYVGSTGWSTGPHLDYGMKLNGAPVNPMSLKLPKGNPLAGEELKKFEEWKNKYDELLK